MERQETERKTEDALIFRLPLCWDISHRAFSYNVVLPLTLSSSPTHYANYAILYTNYLLWHVWEKGSEKSEVTKRYRLSLDILTSIMLKITSFFGTSRCNQFLRCVGFSAYLQGGNTDQPFESIQERGVIYTLLQLSKRQKLQGVITISTGIFGCILCFYANKFKIPVTVVMPIFTSECYVEKCRESGFRTSVIVIGNNILNAHICALRLAEEAGLFYIDENYHPNMIIGQATIGVEIATGITNNDVVILPSTIEECSLTASIAIAIKEMQPAATIIMVKPEVCNVFDKNIKFVRGYNLCQRELRFPTVQYEWYQASTPEPIVDGTYRVTNQSIALAAKILEETKCYIDYNTAIGLASIINGQLNHLHGKRVVIPVFGEMDSDYIVTNQLLLNCADSSSVTNSPSKVDPLSIQLI